VLKEFTKEINYAPVSILAFITVLWSAAAFQSYTIKKVAIPRRTCNIMSIVTGLQPDNRRRIQIAGKYAILSVIRGKTMLKIYARDTGGGEK